jgi:hypothetical protein
MSTHCCCVQQGGPCIHAGSASDRPHCLCPLPFLKAQHGHTQQRNLQQEPADAALTLLSSVSEPSVDVLLLLLRSTTAGWPAVAAMLLPSAGWLPAPVEGRLVTQSALILRPAAVPACSMVCCCGGVGFLQPTAVGQEQSTLITSITAHVSSSFRSEALRAGNRPRLPRRCVVSLCLVVTLQTHQAAPKPGQ